MDFKTEGIRKNVIQNILNGLKNGELPSYTEFYYQRNKLSEKFDWALANIAIVKKVEDKYTIYYMKGCDLSCPSYEFEMNEKQLMKKLQSFIE